MSTPIFECNSLHNMSSFFRHLALLSNNYNISEAGISHLMRMHNIQPYQKPKPKPITLTPVAKDKIVTDDCSICLETLIGSNSVVETVCKHQYHHHCITKWSNSYIDNKICHDCPLCKAKL